MSGLGATLREAVDDAASPVRIEEVKHQSSVVPLLATRKRRSVFAMSAAAAVATVALVAGAATFGAGDGDSTDVLTADPANESVQVDDPASSAVGQASESATDGASAYADAEHGGSASASGEQADQGLDAGHEGSVAPQDPHRGPAPAPAEEGSGSPDAPGYVPPLPVTVFDEWGCPAIAPDDYAQTCAVSWEVAEIILGRSLPRVRGPIPDGWGTRGELTLIEDFSTVETEPGAPWVPLAGRSVSWGHPIVVWSSSADGRWGSDGQGGQYADQWMILDMSIAPGNPPLGRLSSIQGASKWNLTLDNGSSATLHTNLDQPTYLGGNHVHMGWSHDGIAFGIRTYGLSEAEVIAYANSIA